MPESEAKKRIDAQTSRAEREARADFVIDSSGTKEQTKQQVELVWIQLLESARAKG
jgi:dephospho-CoA kinase